MRLDNKIYSGKGMINHILTFQNRINESRISIMSRSLDKIIQHFKYGQMIKASDIFRDREGFGCPYYDEYFTSSSRGFTQHVSKLHP